ncbi:MAG: AraC family transcriptional regulator, partial [Comamonadaceae bacterium]
MAAEAGMSRSGFAAHFLERIGVSPMVYLANWRVQMARELLETTDYTIGNIARRVGYDSESALSAAFVR